MARTYKEAFEYEMNKLRGNRQEQNVFFGNAIRIQNSKMRTYSLRHAVEKKEFACDVLIHCDFCNNTMCDKCKLEAAFKNAKIEIASGERSYERCQPATPKIIQKADKKLGIWLYFAEDPWHSARCCSNCKAMFKHDDVATNMRMHKVFFGHENKSYCPVCGSYNVEANSNADD